MRIGIAGDQIENGGIQQFPDIDDRSGRDVAHQFKAFFEDRPALGGIFPVWRNAERLAEIFLMEALQSCTCHNGTVVALDQEIGSVAHQTRLHRCGLKTRRLGQPHGKGFVLRCEVEARDGRLQNMRRRLARQRQGNTPVRKNNRQFGLRAGQRQPQHALAREERARGQFVEDVDQFRIVQRHRRAFDKRRWRCDARRQELECAGDIAAEPVQQGKIICGRDAERARRRNALALVRQQAAEERPAFCTRIGSEAFWQGSRERERPLVRHPLRGIGKAEFAMLVLRQLARDAPAPPDIETAHHASSSFGGTMCILNPGASSTCSTLPYCFVGLPASSSTMKRTPSRAAPASASCRKPCAFRAFLIIAAISAGVGMRADIFSPSGHS